MIKRQQVRENLETPSLNPNQLQTNATPQPNVNKQTPFNVALFVNLFRVFRRAIAAHNSLVAGCPKPGRAHRPNLWGRLAVPTSKFSGIAMASKGRCNLRPWARNREKSYTAVGSAQRNERRPCPQVGCGGRPWGRPSRRPLLLVPAYGRLWWTGSASPTIAQRLNGGYGLLEVKCRRCETWASIPLDAVRHPRDTNLEIRGFAKCRACRTPGILRPSI